MITLRRAKERRHKRDRERDVWLTFPARRRDSPLADGFGSLEYLAEIRLGPGAGLPQRPAHDAEIITYVAEGALAYDDGMGGSGVVYAGEFLRTTAARAVHPRETNASQTDRARVLQVWLRSSETSLATSHEQRRFTRAERRGRLSLVASPDGRSGSLHLRQDALLYSSLLEPGQHVVHALSQARMAWLHLVLGAVSCDDFVLTTGDGAAVSGERAVSFTALERSELLLIDLAQESRAPPSQRAASADHDPVGPS
ncbi:MAG: quercetin 2,3-dioxygenase [Deltaproteobacteria bacterium HGW-Deltaproteobacteria-14]|jgi:hypothetical protein|nr:MAG: quercetin 2,3-dioxygenase [Deltaproteobacteria bacterium HGW-Deltaproteobacteria-14]